MKVLQPIEIENELIQAYALLTYISEQSESDISEEWNQGLQRIVQMLEVVLKLHRNTAIDTQQNSFAGASAQPSYSTRNQRRAATKRKKKKRA